ncbi:MAG: SDR family oxidoreductase [Magnetococcus sp. WYHC-3]
MKKVMVTGAGGYIGSVLVGQLLERGHQVVALDRFFFGERTLGAWRDHPHLRLVKQDIRDLTPGELEGMDVVCDLAAFSNDPSGDLDPELTREVNWRGRVRVAHMSKQAGVRQYILASSCSVYGQSDTDRDVEESAPTNPLTVYARSNLDAERDVFPLSDGHFRVTALRKGTVFGQSPRMRFDLVINLMTLHAVQKGRIMVTGGGRQWRPLVHVADVARAYLAVMDADPSQVEGQVFNIGALNARVLGLAYTVRETLPFNLEINVATDDPDKRDYRVSFAKAARQIGFRTEKSVADGVREIYEALKQGDVDTGLRSVTVKWYRHLLEAQQLLQEITLNGRYL